MHVNELSASQALEMLEAGNQRYLKANASTGDVSGAMRQQTAVHGQEPFAIVITCSDSRVIPEAVFNAGIGDLFVIRVAGNVIDDHQLGSIEYAASHLGSNLVLVLGHTHCGAVSAAMAGDADGYIRYIVEDIQQAIGGEQDPYQACLLNVRHSMRIIENSLEVQRAEHDHGLEVHGAIYDIETGGVEFLPGC